MLITYVKASEDNAKYLKWKSYTMVIHSCLATDALSLSLYLQRHQMPLQRGREPKPAYETHSARVKHKLNLRHRLAYPPFMDGGNFTDWLLILVLVFLLIDVVSNTAWVSPTEF